MKKKIKLLETLKSNVMKKYVLLLTIIFLASGAFSQDYNISFAGTGAATTVDSVQVKNLKKGTSLSLLGTDVLHLFKYVGIQNLNPGQENVTVYPSPMQEQSELSFYAKDAGITQIIIYDISGKEVASSNTNLSTGQQKFEIKGLNEGSYVVKVNAKQYQYSVKLSSINNSHNLPTISYIGSVNHQVNPILKTALSTINMAFTTGDSMRYTGYSGIYQAIVKEVPTSSKTITFTFTAKLPTLTTTAITGITDTTAISGGNIITDGGASVTARGMCWSTSAKPVVAGNHTTDGTGTGTFSSNIIGLSSNTLYYLRAYATNITGTAYGNQLSLTTLGKPTVTTTAVTGKTDSSAISGGYITSDGGSPITARGVCWGTAANPNISGSHTTDGTGIGSFISYLTGLTTNTMYYVRAYATNSFVTAYGNQQSFKTADSTFICGTSTIVDIDGNIYNTVKIGTQCWMKENLKTTHYADGTGIPLVNTTTTWNALTTTSKAYCWYGDDTANKATYGALYTWAAAMNGAASTTNNPSGIQGVCPNGWHLPSDAEWSQMENYLADNGYNYDGTTGGGSAKIAKSLASTSGWIVSSTTGAVGNTDYPTYRNKSGFTALPGGYRSINGTFYGIGYYGNWWSATEYSATYAWNRYVYYYLSYVGSTNFYKEVGFSVRCLRD